MDNVNGIILVNKPKDWTSQDVLSKLKRYFHVDKIGHAGTLDPLATGLLVVLLGSSFLFGSIGGLCGMYLLRHKTKHWYFVVINFLSLIIHIALGVYLFKVKGFIFI